MLSVLIKSLGIWSVLAAAAGCVKGDTPAHAPAGDARSISVMRSHDPSSAVPVPESSSGPGTSTAPSSKYLHLGPCKAAVLAMREPETHAERVDGEVESAVAPSRFMPGDPVELHWAPGHGQVFIALHEAGATAVIVTCIAPNTGSFVLDPALTRFFLYPGRGWVTLARFPVEKGHMSTILPFELGTAR